ncbi:TrmH family RNA methyltransferase [Propionivibrio limicola]|uniref:TrmH family RNA methyltransferase n=1 Tax=Propionivibrio limicola TaxID=167645 RepID=UPI001292256B|nr:RNA methyltransferase [Propionivibrio limicola]
MKHIVSRDNPHFKLLKRLCNSGRERRKSGLIILDGMHLLESYAQHIGHLDEVIVSRTGLEHPEIRAFVECVPQDTKVCVLLDGLYADLAQVETPSGIMAIAGCPKTLRDPDVGADAVLLDGVQDPGNLGSIFRTAAAAGVGQVLLSSACAQAWSPKVLRAAMGAHFLLDIFESEDLPTFLAHYQGESIVTSLEAQATYFSLDLRRSIAWIFGNEGQGVRPEVSAHARRQVKIPMPGSTESLNVGAAVAICLFEAVRQRREEFSAAI